MYHKPARAVSIAAEHLILAQKINANPMRWETQISSFPNIREWIFVHKMGQPTHHLDKPTLTFFPPSTNTRRLRLASFHLEGGDQLWFLKLKRDCPDLTWELFTQYSHLRFGPQIRNKLGELSKLRQTGTVGEYQCQFEQLSAHASSLTSEQEVEIFISGLQEHIPIEVNIHHPKDLTTAMGLAHLYERRTGTRQSKKAHIPNDHRPIEYKAIEHFINGGTLKRIVLQL